jgi:hypothetical protein
MKIKFYSVVMAIMITCMYARVNAQLQVKSTGTSAGNFTSFSAEKTYDDMTLLKAITAPAYYNNPDFGKRINDKTEWYEQIDKRTLKTRTYKGTGNQVIVETGYDNLNFTDADGWLRAVNTKLTASSNGWSAEQQETPVYLYHDGSTALSLGGNDLMLFNKNVQFNGKGISTNGYTVGDNGMYIKNTVPNTDKIICFGRGRIETDYKITQPLKSNTDLVISEDVILPAGYTISENENYNTETDHPGSLIVKGNDGKATAKLKAPYCYDNNGNSIFGAYELQKQNNGYHLQVVISSVWLNDPARQYPVTIDPVVTSDTIVWPGGIISSCLNSFGNDTGTLEAVIPAGVTITGVYIQSNFYSNSLPDSDGRMFFWTPCGDTIPSATLSAAMGGGTSGYDFIAPPYNFLSLDPLYARCFVPSCDSQYLPITMAIVRFAGGTGCNFSYIYYDPTNTGGYPFEAYVVGNTVQVSSWSILPDPICEYSCNITLKVTANYGVPPYIISHPWSANDTVGSYDTAFATSSGVATMTLTIPNCSDTAVGTLMIPPPTITDACGNVVSGLTTRTIPVIQAPNKPVITKSGDVLTSSATQFNQWNLNGNAIKGATHETDTATTSGCYSVTVENLANDDCSTTSDTLCVTAGIASVNRQNNNIIIYPNPANNSTTVEFTVAEHNVQLSLINVLGQTLYSEILMPINGNNYRTNLNLLQLPAGVYEVVITTPSQSVAKEIIKQE